MSEVEMSYITLFLIGVFAAFLMAVFLVLLFKGIDGPAKKRKP